MRRRKDDFGHAESRWARRELFGERRRRRLPWKPLLVALAVGSAAIALSDGDRRDWLLGLWTEATAPAAPEAAAEIAATPSSMPAAANGPEDDALPLPPAPPVTR